MEKIGVSGNHSVDPRLHARRQVINLPVLTKQGIGAPYFDVILLRYHNPLVKARFFYEKNRGLKKLAKGA